MNQTSPHTQSALRVFMYFFLPHPLFKPHTPLPTHLRVTYVNFSAEFLTAREKHIFIIQRRPHYTTYWFPPPLAMITSLHVCVNYAKMLEHREGIWGYHVSVSALSVIAALWHRTHTQTHTHARRETHTHTQQGAHCLGIKLGFPFKKWKLLQNCRSQSQGLSLLSLLLLIK